MDHEMQHTQRANDVTRAWQLLQRAARDVIAAILKLWRRIKIRSVTRCVFTSRMILPNFIPIRFERTEPKFFFEERRRTTTRRRTRPIIRRVAIWDKFLIKKKQKNQANLSLLVHIFICLLHYVTQRRQAAVPWVGQSHFFSGNS